MANNLFARIGIYSKTEGNIVKEALKNLYELLTKQNNHTIILENAAAKLLAIKTQNQVFALNELAKHCDLMIVVGGDGSFLKAARAIVDYNIPIIGINCGKLGFMTDLGPNELTKQLPSILAGDYIEDQRCLLAVKILRAQTPIFANKALNDVVLYNGNMARLMEFEIFIDQQFVMSQRSDGIITATTTGSTAYALSSGGPILSPNINAFTLVPINPHTLSSRPIVIQDNSVIRYVIPNKKHSQYKLACDGQVYSSLAANDEIIIAKYAKLLTIIHPKEHNHFTLLRNKFGWGTYASPN